MSSEDQAQALSAEEAPTAKEAPAAMEAPAAKETPAAKKAPAAKAVMKTKVKGKESASGTPRFKDMVIDAITTQKERSGSSLGAIKNHLSSKYKVDAVKKAVTLNRFFFSLRLYLC